jgi:outer membrane lipopolysaccharide assembly protein LptE/RlpB
MTRKHIYPALALLLPIIILSGCGYALEGRGSFLPSYILRIGVPTFKNLTTTPGLEETITAEIYSEFLSRGDFQLSAETTGVDAVLTGEITSYRYFPKAVDDQGMATSYLIYITADISFRDLVQDKVIWEQKGYRFQSEYQLSQEGADFVSQEAESIQRAAEDFARSVVSTILTGF